MDILTFSNLIKDIAQIVFWCIIATVTILSYFQARKTLFSPIKTEIFKMQIKTFEDILKYFQLKTSIDFERQFELDFIFELNTKIMLQKFSNAFFVNKTYVASMKKLIDKSNGFIVQDFYEEKFYSQITDEELFKNKEDWQKYEHGIIYITRKYIEEDNVITSFISSPLIPEQLKEKLIEFRQIVSNNISLMANMLTEAAQELPDNYETVESVDKFNYIEFYNFYNNKSEKLFPKAEDILNYLRSYLKIESLIE